MDKATTPARTKILKNGAVYDLDKGRIVANPGGGTSAITPARSRELREIRAAKVARLTRQKITAATAKISDLPIRSSAEAVAEVAGILWEEIVLNAEAYPRDRMEAFEKLTERAEMTTNIKRQDAEKNNDAAIFLNATTELLRELRSVIQPAEPRETIDGTATDIRMADNQDNGG